MQMFQQLNLPQIEPRLQRDATGRLQIYDQLRSKYVPLTPEEWVRQHFVAMLADRLGYPRGLMANEVSIRLNGLSRRCDTVVYDRHARPVMIVEYKAPDIQLDRRVFDQILRYNSVLRASWLVISNGMQHIACRLEYEPLRPEFVETIPPFDSL